MPGVQGRSPERFLLRKSAGAQFSGLKPQSSTTVSHSGAILVAGENQYLDDRGTIVVQSWYDRGTIVVGGPWVPNEAFGSEMKDLCL